MDKRALIIKGLSIRKMPGFPSGMEPYEDFADQLNIVAGPNASGKSSTAKLIQQLIWRDHNGNIQASGSFKIDNEPWQIRIDPIQIKTERNGVADELTGLPPAESRDHYMLAMHELINTEDKNLARQIAREAIGGYDPEVAAQKLNYSDKVRNKSSREYTNFIKARQHFREIFRQQQQLKREEDTLDHLNSDKQKTEKAGRLKDFYTLAKEYLETRQAFDISRNNLNLFPNLMEKVSGDEFSRITELEEDLDQAVEKIDQAKQVIENRQDSIAALQLPPGGIAEEIIEALEGKATELADYEKEVRVTNQNLKEAETRTLAALKAIDRHLDSGNWEGLELNDVQELDEYLETAQKLLSQKQFLEHEISELEKEISPDPPPPSESLQTGIIALSNWLQEEQSHSGLPGKWGIILATTGAITAIVTMFAGMYGLTGIVLLVLLTYYAFNVGAPRKNNIREKDYGKTGLPIPRSWSTEAVYERLDSLLTSLQETKRREKIIPRLELRQKDLDDVNRQMKDILRKEQELKKKLGTVPGIPSESPGSHSSLYWFLSNILEWKKHHTNIEALKTQKDSLQDHLRQLLDELNTGFSQFRMDEVADAHQAKAICKKLTREEDTRRSSLEEIKRQEERIQENKKVQQEKNQKLHALYTYLGLNYGEKEKIRLLTEKKEQYQEAVTKHNQAKFSLMEKEQALKNHSLYPDHAKEIEKLSVDEVASKRQKFENEAARAEEVNKKITEIHTKIGVTSQGDKLEDALTAKEKTLDELELLFEHNLSGMTGHLLINKLRETTQTQNKSKVYNKAGKLFSRITNGRYELRISDINRAAFLAYDTNAQQGQSLEELSTGTRLQLLLSVRLAFIETRESYLRLPLLADELLANSDDVRAGAIMQALIAFSQGGRQVFYFTAQEDEVAKWKMKLRNQPAIPHKIFRLQNNQHPGWKEPEGGKTFFLPPFENPEVPSPSGLDHPSYGKAISVPPFSIIKDQPGKLHLWYLITDTKLLYECMRKNISSWGQLSSYFEHGGHLEGFTESTVETLHKKMKVLGRFQELFRKGRPGPLDMEALDDAGVISPAFREKVYKKLEACHGNPAKLLESLQNKEIPGFRASKIEELESYLHEKGYLDDMDPLSMEEIMLQLQAFCSALKMDLPETESFLGRVLK